MIVAVCKAMNSMLQEAKKLTKHLEKGKTFRKKTKHLEKAWKNRTKLLIVSYCQKFQLMGEQNNEDCSKNHLNGGKGKYVSRQNI